MARSNLAAASQALAELYGRHRLLLPDYQWENENTRWQELLVAALTQAAGLELVVARRAIRILAELNVLSVDVLRKSRPEAKRFIATVFHQCGARPANAVAATKLLCALSERVHQQWDGHVHRLLRMFAGPMTREVGRLFEGTGVSARKVRRAAVTWLQNVSHIPVLVPEDPHIESFLSEHALTERDLLALADGTGLNLSVLDDILLLEHRSRAAAHASEKRNGSRAKAVKQGAATQPRVSASNRDRG